MVRAAGFERQRASDPKSDGISRFPYARISLYCLPRLDLYRANASATVENMCALRGVHWIAFGLGDLKSIQNFQTFFTS